MRQIRKPLRLLYLDDEPITVKQVTSMLETHGFSCTYTLVDNQRDFTRALHYENFDLICSDYYLPDFNGMAALKMSQRKCPGVPFIFIAGAVGEEVAIECLKNGAADVVFKRGLDRLVPAVQKTLREMDERFNRKRAEDALQQSEEKYRTLFEDSKDAIFTCTSDGRFIDINRAGLDLFGYDSKDAIFKEEPKDIYRDPKDQIKLIEALQKEGYVKAHELILKGKDGREIIVHKSATAVRDGMGRMVAYRGIIHDLTEIKKLERQLAHAQKMETIGTLAGGIAHDFNNLLTVILGNVEFGKQELKPEDSIYQDLLQIENAAIQARDLTNQLLSFSRKQEIKLESVNINKIIEDIAKMKTSILRENIQLITNLDQELFQVKADPTQIQQVLMNFCVNARDAMPGGGLLKLTTGNVTSDRVKSLVSPKGDSGKFVQIVISDTGTGMDEKTMARIFEPFFTTKEVGKGTGLGLSVVYGIIKQHNGHIGVSSMPNKGTSFQIFLPAEELAEEIPQKGKTNEIQGGNERILVVEDEEIVSKVTNRILHGLGYSTLQACDGLEAVTVFKEEFEKIDLIIMDVVLPKLSGPDAYKRMMAMRPGLPVLFVTGYDFTEELDNLVQLDEKQIDILRKPYTREELADKVRAILDSAKVETRGRMLN